jgi:hypothetical protein
MIMQAYEVGSPRYFEMLDQYNAQCAPAQQFCGELRMACLQQGKCRRYRQICQ